ncbi:ribose-phosphate diphosphokinase [Pseudomonas sp. sp1636]|uniref:ribose-phosphate diphosphokinase n=1 Tax=Pseudomonas sp. sp1636 TaxID=3036707 RepID=UPI0025A503CB|nr:ribose-phosphate diphosphokinase [Pseudomonas sp. sp1636]MDM8349671.1 ribose-phosphate diphosphokinase [Pseudomonas sp. sp1636]
MNKPLLFSLEEHPLTTLLGGKLGAEYGELSRRDFPDGESYVQIRSPVAGRHCLVLANLAQPNDKYLPLLFLLDTLRELGAASVGLVAPYLSYMRQDRRFVDGEAVTSRLFAKSLSRHMDWLVSVDPHLHRYHSLDEIYSVPSRVVQGASALARWLGGQHELLLVGPDAESEQWVASIAAASGHPYVIGEKQRLGDRQVIVSLADLSPYQGRSAVIIDDVISTGQTLLHCIAALQAQQFERIQCAAVHGIFADHSDQLLLAAGLQALVTSNTIPHASNGVDISELLLAPINECLQLMVERTL